MPEDSEEVASDGQEVRTSGSPGKDVQQTKTIRSEKSKLTRANGKANTSKEPKLFVLKPRVCQAECSVAGLPVRQEDEFMVIKEIFAGAVQELSLDSASGGDKCSKEEASDSLASFSLSSSEQDKCDNVRPSTPVRRYRVSLSANSMDGGVSNAAEGSDGPTAKLDVSYGRLYPLETPRLVVHTVDGLPKGAWQELVRRITTEVDKLAGQECVYDVCSSISDLLRQYHDPSADIPLHERMQRRQAAEAEQRDEAARLDRERAQKKAAEAWEQQMRAEQQRLQRYEEKRRMAERVGDCKGGGTLDFLPEDSEVGTAMLAVGTTMVAAPAPRPNAGLQKVKTGRACAQAVAFPLYSDSQNPDSAHVSTRFQGTRNIRPPAASSDDESLPSFSEGSCSGVVFEASVEEIRPSTPPPVRPLPKSKASPKASQKSTPKPKLAANAKARLEARNTTPGADRSEGNQSVPSGRYASDFEELRLLGKGGFGVVMKVRHRVDRQLYAIKRLSLEGSASDRQRLLNECALLPRLTHLHIVRYYQAWIETEQVETARPPSKVGASAIRGNAGRGALARRTSVRTVPAEILPEGDDWLSLPGTAGAWKAGQTSLEPGSSQKEILYIQMEFCDGTTLREAINSGELHKDEALIWKLFRQVLDALAYLHSKGLIHRDIKPPNIFLSRADGGHAKLGDFGLSTNVDWRHCAVCQLEWQCPEPTDAVCTQCKSQTSNGRLPLGSKAEQLNNEKQQSTGVGTALYMAPEVKGLKAGRDEGFRPYDDRADMFSLGIVFFEMWRPAFFTGMERVQVLGRLGDGFSTDRGKVVQELEELLPNAPSTALEILASLLATEPEARMTADHLLNRSGLLPSGAFDPQVQRVLKALEDPSSSESVALLQALFNRTEEQAKDVPFFEQLFKPPECQTLSPEAEIEARDAALQLLRELFRKHGASYELCPLLSPAVRSVPLAPTEAGSPRSVILPKSSDPCGVHLVDACNTLLELRANLTEPFARATAARHGSVLEDEEDSGLFPAQTKTQRRRYHVGTVYRQAVPSETHALSRFGHPREVSSAVVQFLWCATEMSSHHAASSTALPAASNGNSGGHFAEAVPRQASRRHAMGQKSMAHMQEAELLHMLGEVLSATGLGSRVEFRLSDTRLLPLLLEVAYHRALREPVPPNAAEVPVADRSASNVPPNGERLRSRLVDALKMQAVKLGSSANPAAMEKAAADLAGFLGSASGTAESPKLAASFLAEAEEQYAPSATSPSSGSGQQSSPRELSSCPAVVETLRNILRNLRGLARCLEGLIKTIVVDALMPIDLNTYGQGLAFRGLLHATDGTSTVVCVGGRIDRMVSRFARLHAPRGSEEVDMQAGSSELCAVSAEFAVDKIAAALVQAAQAQAQGVAASGAHGGRQRGRSSSTASAVAPWWRQSVGCWPQVILGPGSEGEALAAQDASAHAEAMKVASGLWRLGAGCQLWPPGAGRLDSGAVLKHAPDGVSGPTLPDFIVTVHNSSSLESSAAAPGFKYSVRAISEQGQELMERSAKDTASGAREMEDRGRLFDFFERVARRQPAAATARLAGVTRNYF
eukprot:TRINITY_DN33216_c0_g1_i1.p1 TRINITY_DN33216_c0_g1~~TRINITY_DN33216_c0_g1_i1.p1  ORF type:complete len:1572 (-),score=289.98 TRINITY_DN33216_c0_g1_i1:89-4804(-)